MNDEKGELELLNEFASSVKKLAEEKGISLSLQCYKDGIGISVLSLPNEGINVKDLALQLSLGESIEELPPQFKRFIGIIVGMDQTIQKAAQNSKENRQKLERAFEIFGVKMEATTVSATETLGEIYGIKENKNEL